MFNNNSRDRGNLAGVPVRDNYYNNGPTPAQFIDNMQDRCLFTRNNNNFQNVTQDNKIGFDNSLKSDNRGMFLHENNYINRPLLDNNLNEAVRNEYIDERDIIIDTIDRDTSIYPNIFNFTLKLGSTDTTSGPSVHRSIQNVKYLKLVKAIFPDNYWTKESTCTVTAVNTAMLAFLTDNNYTVLDTTVSPNVYRNFTYTAPTSAQFTDNTLYDTKFTDGTETLYVIYYPVFTTVNTSSTTTSSSYDLGISELLANSNITLTTPTDNNINIKITGLTSNSINLAANDIIQISGSTITTFNDYYKVISVSSVSVNSVPYYPNNTTYTFTITCGKNGVSSVQTVSTGLVINKYPNAVEHSNFFIDFYREVSGEPDHTAIYQYRSEDTSVSISNPTYHVYSTATDCQIEKGRFYQLHIDQLPKNNDLATSNTVRNSFSLLYPGKEDTRGYNTLDGMETDKIFRFSNLGNFTNFSIKILDSAGDDMTSNDSIWNKGLDNINSKSKIENTNEIAQHPVDQNVAATIFRSGTKDDYKYSFRSPSKYLRHPLSWIMQAQFIFTVGEIQIEMNKKTFN